MNNLSEKRNKNLIHLIRLIVSLGVVFFLFKRIPFFQILKIIQESNIFFLFISFLFFILLHFLGVLRWKILLSPLIKTNFIHLAFPFFSGLFFNLFFPSTLAGDFFRGMVLRNEKRPMSFLVTSIFLDRMSGFLALTTICVASFLVNPKLIKEKEIVLIAFLFLLGISFVVFLIFSKRFMQIVFNIFKKYSSKLENLKKALVFFKNNPKIFFKSVGISFLIQIANILSIWFIFLSFGEKLNLLDVFTLGTISTFLSLVPISIAGLGVRDASFIFFFSKVGVKNSISFAASLLIFIYGVIMGLVGGGIFALLYNRWIQLNKQLTFFKE